MKKIGILLISTLIIFIGCYVFIHVTKKETSSNYETNVEAKTLNIASSAKNAFKTAAKQYVGMNLEPIALLGTKKENGDNYAYLVKSTTKSEKEETNWKLITVNINSKNESNITKINDININDYDTTELQEFSEENSWNINSKYGKSKIDAKVKNYFDILEFKNIEYKPITLLGTKNEDGINYAILCLGKLENKSYSLDVVIMNVKNNKPIIKTINKFKLSDVN